MVTRYAVYLDKKGLAAIDPAIYILDVAYTPPTITTTANDIPGMDGQRSTNRRADRGFVSIPFEIHEQNTRRRQDICRKVQAWAMAGGILTTNDRPGERLRVVCDDPPTISSALRWTQQLRIGFAAYDPPYWEDEYERSTTVSGTAGTGSLYVGGMGAMARVSAAVKNTSGSTINALTVEAGGKRMEFTGLALASGKTLDIDYDENMLLRIRVGDTSKMKCRTAGSDDELLIKTGTQAQVKATAGASVSATFRARGLYL